MNYVIKLSCINRNNPYNLMFGQEVWISDVFGTEKKFTKDKDRAYKFLSVSRASNIAQKIQANKYFHPIVIKTY